MWERIQTSVGQPESLAAILVRSGLPCALHRWKYRSVFFVWIQHGRMRRAEFDETADGNFPKLTADRKAVEALDARLEWGKGTQAARTMQSIGRGGRRRAPGESNIERVAI